MTIPENRAAPVNIRALPSQRNLIDKAAQLLHKTRSDFMLEAACKEAENVLLDRRLFLVTEQQFSAFESLLNHPLQDIESLQKLLNTKSPWEK